MYWILLFSILAATEPRPMAEVVVLGVVQDAGLPQLGCENSCCLEEDGDPRPRQSTSSIAVVLTATGQSFLFDATPDIREQLALLRRHESYRKPGARRPVDGVFLTHAHMGHYTGLMHFGFESMSTDAVPVHCTERFAKYLETSGPWSQLVTKKNIVIRPFEVGTAIEPAPGLKVTAFLVPHRDEYSDTVGYRIEAGDDSLVFLPDIDHWTEDVDIRELVRSNAHVLIDATFYSGDELPGRDLSQIPHPRIVDTMKLLEDRPEEERARVRFIHLNHTNPALRPGSAARRAIEDAGFRVASIGEVIPLGE
ncbi:MAG: MBL fold metallo-hydrolase [Planctomycetota bacterium]